MRGLADGARASGVPGVQTVGIIQEQHPARCSLFMQWKGMDWPVMWDPLNLLEVRAVPLTYAIDEQGIVLARLRKPAELRGVWGEDPPAPAEVDPITSPAAAKPAVRVPDLAALRRAASAAPTGDRGAYANALALWGGSTRAGDAVEAYSKALAGVHSSGAQLFRHGVVLRMRYDSSLRQPGDFQAAVDAWQAALAIDPNQYIWRRRIQQYGPRLAKPYPFYDWVAEARADIRARGAEPVALASEPGAAERAGKAAWSALVSTVAEPDPRGRIDRDHGVLVQTEVTVVPAKPRAGETVRVHIDFVLAAAGAACWNNTSKDLTVWIQPPPGWESDRASARFANPRAPESRDRRRVEFELRVPAGTKPGEYRPLSYALYYICEQRGSRCLYRRQDVDIVVTVRP